MASGAAQALLHVLWGALSPPGAGRWYFLLALRLLALAFARGAWRGPPHDLLCAWAPPGPAPRPPPPGLRRLCAALCYNRHFPAPVAALWSLSFLLALLPITLLRLLHPAARPPRRGREDDGRDANVAAGGDEEANVAAGRGDTAAGRGDVAAGRTNVAAGRDREGVGEGSGGEDKMATGRGHKMAAGQRGNGRNKMAAWPGPGDESSALMWLDELEAAARPRPGRDSNMAAGHHPLAKSKMAAWRHPANGSGAASRSDESNVAAGCCPFAQPKMAAGRCLTGGGDAAPWSDNMAAGRGPAAGSNMAAGRGPAAGSNMAARHRPAAGSNMAARHRLAAGSNMAASPSLPALPAPGGHDGRGRWRAWLGAGAAAMLAAGEGGFLWAVLWRQLPAVSAAPIGCRLPVAAPCPPLACAVPARADKMAALLGLAASAAVSLLAVMAAAVMAAGRALRGRGPEGEGPA
ncbi:uncharacterized protein LOC141972938 [Athene noctua]|uniref:uncharacterized protein LOC141972938 n=1 Tax=Athene noctua TaxID=126797 RepID=UPI003EB9DF09